MGKKILRLYNFFYKMKYFDERNYSYKKISWKKNDTKSVYETKEELLILLGKKTNPNKLGISFYLLHKIPT